VEMVGTGQSAGWTRRTDTVVGVQAKLA